MTDVLVDLKSPNVTDPNGESTIKPPLGGIVDVINVDESLPDKDRVEQEHNEEAEVKMSQIYERSELKPENILITDAGTLTGGEDIKWPGFISLKNRLFKRELDGEKVDRVLSPSNIKKYFVRAYRSARTRCVDGRCIEGYEENREEMKERDLGAQVSGGSAGMAVSIRIADGPNAETDSVDSTFKEDMESISSEMAEMGIEIGGHSDNHAEVGEKTGCGAVDNMPEIVKNMTDARYATRQKDLVKSVLGKMYDSRVYSEVLGNAMLLEAEEESYFKDYKHTVFEIMKKQSKNAISKLFGNHNEIAVIVNNIYGMTFHRDEFSSDNGHEIQSFNYDVWRTMEVVETFINMSPKYKKLSEEERDIAAKKLLTTRVMYSVATLVTLTDGSLKLFVANEKTDDNQETGEEGHVIELFKDFGNREKYVPEEVLPIVA